MSGHLENRRARQLVVVMCVLLYLVLGLARYDYGACLPAILGSEPMDKGQAGFISTLNFLFYALGNMLGGFLADRVKPRRLIFLALLLSGASNLVFFSARSYALMAAAWCVNGLAQGPVFCSVIRLLNDVFPPDRVTAPSVAVQCAFTLGLSAAYAAAAPLLRSSGWRAVFLLAGLCTLLFALLWRPAMAWAERVKPGDAPSSSPQTSPQPEDPSPSAPRLLRQAGFLALPLALVAQGVLRDGVNTWGPTYVEETFSLGSALAAASSTVIPLAAVAGIFAANLLKKHMRGNELSSAALSFALSAAAMAVLAATAGVSLPLSVSMLALSAACMAGTNAMLINAVPLHFGKFGRTGAVSGILNTMVYAGSGASTYGIGVVVASLGWKAANLCWLALAAAAALVCLLTAPRWRRFKVSNGLA